MDASSVTARSSGGRELPVDFEQLRAEFEEAQQIVTAIREGAVDGFVVQEPHGESVYTLRSANLALSILEQAAEVLIVCDRRGVIRRASRVAEELLGGPLTGRRFGEALPLVYGAADQAASSVSGERPFNIAPALAGDALRGMEVLLPRAAEPPIAFLLSAGPVHNDRGQVVGCIITLTDITRRVAAERALRSSEEMTHRMLASSRDCIKLLDPHGKLLSMSASGQSALGIDELQPLLNTPWVDFFAADDRRLALAAIDAARSGRTGRFIARCGSRSGTPLWWDSAVTPLLDANGRPEQLLVVSRDITEQKQIEERLQQRDRRKTEFLAMLGHELRNPLVPLRSGLDLLAMSPENRAVTELMREQLDYLIRLVDDLLDVSRIVQGKIELRRRPVVLAELIEQALGFARAGIEERRHQLTCTLPEEPVPLEADPVRLAQAITNLLHNASKYTDPGGTISLAAEVEGGEVVIRVRDNGIGIDPDFLPRVFDLFAQASASDWRSEGGLGVGLTLVHRIATLHGGTVSAHSEGPGRGSEFVLRLPRLLERDVPAEAPVGRQRRAATRARRILIVEDNTGAARLLKMLLEKLGAHEIAVAHDGEAALEAAESCRPDVVLLDVGLPGIDGCECARRLRARPEFASTLLVALTGYGQGEDRARTQAAGFDEHLVKPPSLDEIEAILAHPKLLQ